jgi:RNA polymerase II C-terminal domain phosphatase-like 1/2
VVHQVEIGGQILGKGVGATWEQAKLQAADEALGNLKSMLGIFAHKSSGFQRSSVSNFNRFKPDFQRSLQTIPSGWDSRNNGRVL